MENKAEKWIRQLGLAPIAEGGWCVRNYTSQQQIGEGEEKRPIGSCICYLLEGRERSCFHVLESDEIWFFHGGDPFELYSLWPDGSMKRTVLGPDPEAGQTLQVVYPAGVIFGGRVLGEYGLAGCFVSPAFEDKRFRLTPRSELLRRFPQHADVICALTQEDETQPERAES